jgi:hypothetical protein
LDVDAIDRDTAEFYVAVGDILNEASSIEVGLDAGAVLGVDDRIVSELGGRVSYQTASKILSTYKNVRDIVITFTTYRPNAQSMASVTIHVGHCDIIATGNSHTIILIVYKIISNYRIIGGAHIESI